MADFNTAPVNSRDDDEDTLAKQPVLAGPTQAPPVAPTAPAQTPAPAAASVSTPVASSGPDLSNLKPPPYLAASGPAYSDYQDPSKSLMESVDRANANIAKTPSEELQAQNRAAFAALGPGPDVRELTQLYDKYHQQYQDEKDNIKQRALIETVAQALTQLFAARKGLEAGVDVSNVQFQKTDFDKKLELNQAELKDNIAQAKEEFATQTATFANKIKAAHDEGSISVAAAKVDALAAKNTQESDAAKTRETGEMTRARMTDTRERDLNAANNATKLQELNAKPVDASDRKAYDAYQAVDQQIQELKALRARGATPGFGSETWNKVKNAFGVGDSDQNGLVQGSNNLALLVSSTGGNPRGGVIIDKFKNAIANNTLTPENYDSALSQLETTNKQAMTNMEAANPTLKKIAAVLPGASQASGTSVSTQGADHLAGIPPDELARIQARKAAAAQKVP